MSQQAEDRHNKSEQGQKETGKTQKPGDTPRGLVEEITQQFEQFIQLSSPEVLNSPARITRSQTGSLPGQR